MKLHERTMIVQAASCEFHKFELDWMQKYNLTYGELLGIYAERIATWAKYMRRDERHPDDPEKRGDEE